MGKPILWGNLRIQGCRLFIFWTAQIFSGVYLSGLRQCSEKYVFTWSTTDNKPFKSWGQYSCNKADENHWQSRFL